MGYRADADTCEGYYQECRGLRLWVADGTHIGSINDNKGCCKALLHGGSNWLWMVQLQVYFPFFLSTAFTCWYCIWPNDRIVMYGWLYHMASWSETSVFLFFVLFSVSHPWVINHNQGNSGGRIRLSRGSIMMNKLLMPTFTYDTLTFKYDTKLSLCYTFLKFTLMGNLHRCINAKTCK